MPSRSNMQISPASLTKVGFTILVHQCGRSQLLLANSYPIRQTSAHAYLTNQWRGCHTNQASNITRTSIKNAITKQIRRRARHRIERQREKLNDAGSWSTLNFQNLVNKCPIKTSSSSAAIFNIPRPTTSRAEESILWSHSLRPIRHSTASCSTTTLVLRSVMARKEWSPATVPGNILSSISVLFFRLSPKDGHPYVARRIPDSMR